MLHELGKRWKWHPSVMITSDTKLCVCSSDWVVTNDIWWMPENKNSQWKNVKTYFTDNLRFCQLLISVEHRMRNAPDWCFSFLSLFSASAAEKSRLTHLKVTLHLFYVIKTTFTKRNENWLDNLFVRNFSDIVARNKSLPSRFQVFHTPGRDNNCMKSAQ